MKPTLRSYQSENDYWRIREFLRECFLLNGRREYCWSLLRWDYWMWHVNENIFQFKVQDVTRLWELDGKIVAMLNTDGPAEAYFQVHPAYCGDDLWPEMLDIAEKDLPNHKEDGKKDILAWVREDDDFHKKLLTGCGYIRSKFKAEHLRRRFLSEPVAGSPLQDGYTVRALGDQDELPARSWLSWKVFHPDEPAEKYQGWEWYKNVQRVPIYRRDLDIVAVAPDGELAAFCTVWFDDVTRTAVFEPVGTHPNHQKRGLGKAVMNEGLRRAQRLGATLATVSSYSDGAHALYESMGFSDLHLSEPWIKEWA
jgi:mycothiol synthase